MKLIDLHMHTFFSDGILSPAELVYRYKLQGAERIAITDHADYSNMEFIVKSLHKAAPKFKEYYDMDVIIGVELTYIPPDDIEDMVSDARKIGAELVVVHGETSAENVPAGTNLAAVQARCDILAHPGHLTDEIAQVAEKNNVYIELTTRNGHGNTNKEVFTVANKNKCGIVLNTDSHGPDDLLDEFKIRKLLNQCGIDFGYYNILRDNSLELVERLNRQR